MRYDPQALIDQEFGRLTVREFVGRDEYGVALYRCDCACEPGKSHIAKRKNLVNGSTKSCGCLKYVAKGQGQQTRYYTAEMKRAKALRDEPVSYKIITHR